MMREEGNGPPYQMLLRYKSNLLPSCYQMTYMNSVRHTLVRVKESCSSVSKEVGQEGCSNSN